MTSDEQSAQSSDGHVTSLDYLGRQSDKIEALTGLAYGRLLDSDVQHASSKLGKYTAVRHYLPRRDNWGVARDVVHAFDAYGECVPRLESAPLQPGRNNAYQRAIKEAMKWPEMHWKDLSASHAAFSQMIKDAGREVNPQYIETVYIQLRAPECEEYALKTRVAQAHNILCKEVGVRNIPSNLSCLERTIERSNLPVTLKQLNDEDVGVIASVAMDLFDGMFERKAAAVFEQINQDVRKCSIARDLLSDIDNDTTVTCPLVDAWAKHREMLNSVRKFLVWEEDFVRGFYITKDLRHAANRLAAFKEQSKFLPPKLHAIYSNISRYYPV